MEMLLDDMGLVVMAKPQVERLDAAEAPHFKGQLVDLVNRGHSLLILDLSSVKFMDSSGLGAMLSCMKTITTSGGKLAVVGVTGHLANLFTLTKLERVIPIYDSTEKAREALA